MFFALGRLVVIMLVVSTIVYVCLWFYARATQKERLEEAWEEAGRPGPLSEYVESGLAQRKYSLRRKLLLGVYVVPFILVSFMVYVTNYN